MQQLPDKCDVLVVGGGMVGGLFALALEHTGLDVVVVENRLPEPFSTDDNPDLRVSALSLASERMLAAVGAWPGITARRCCPYRHMRVWDGEEGGETSFFSGDVGETHLGHIVENRVVQWSLLERLDAAAQIHLECPAQLDSLYPQTDKISAVLDDGRTLSAKLVVGADGARSRVRELAGIRAAPFKYAQHALVATVRTRAEQQAVTWQRFMPEGPQAFLPLVGQHGSVVWYHNAAEVERLLALGDDDFLQALCDAFPSELGELDGIIGRAAFPLTRSHAERYVTSRIALIGDAAHTVHPLAGQGVNMGLLDAGALSEVIIRANRSGHDIGDLLRLRPYERWRRAENALMIEALDGFYRAFRRQPALLRRLRSTTLGLADRLSPIKSRIIKHACGSSGDLPILATGRLP